MTTRQSTRHQFMLIALILVLLSVGFCSITVFIQSGQAWPVTLEEYLNQVRSRVKIGDERDMVVKTLMDAWYHGVCDRSSGIRPSIDDVFLYGPRQREQVRMIVITSEPSQGKMRVSDIGGVENYLMLAYEKCLPPEFQSNSTKP